MSINILIPLISAIVYLILIILVLASALNRIKQVFIVYLVLTMLWSFTSFLLHANLLPEHELIIHECLLVFGFTMSVSLYYFISVFTNRVQPSLLILSFLFIIAIIVLSFGGYILENSSVVNSFLYYKTSSWFYVLLLGSARFGASAYTI